MYFLKFYYLYYNKKIFCIGNHEYYHSDVDNWISFFISKLKLTVLRNNNQIVQPSKSIYDNGYNTICFAGVDDLITEHLFFRGFYFILIKNKFFLDHKMNITKALSSCPPKSTIIVLAHQPNAARKIIDTAKRKIHLILSGLF